MGKKPEIGDFDENGAEAGRTRMHCRQEDFLKYCQEHLPSFEARYLINIW